MFCRFGRNLGRGIGQSEIFRLAPTLLKASGMFGEAFFEYRNLIPRRIARGLGIVATILTVALAATPAHTQDLLEPWLQGSPAPDRYSITPEQTADFAYQLGEPVETVAWRLAEDPRLVPLAAAAVGARTARKKTGRNMVIAGFTFLGAGLTAGFMVSMQGLCFGNSADCQAKSAEADRNGEIVMIAGAVVGALLAVPGFVKMAGQSELEDKAVDYYWSRQIQRPVVFAPEARPSWSSGSAGRSLPLFSWSSSF
jgi:hypothetical protein